MYVFFTNYHWYQEVRSRRGLYRLPPADLHWLYVLDRVLFKLAVTVRRCLQHCVTILHTSLWSWQSTTSAIGHSSSASTDHAMSPQHIRPLGFHCCWPDVLELTGRWTANFSCDMFKAAVKTFRHLTSVYNALRWRASPYKLMIDIWHKISVY